MKKLLVSALILGSFVTTAYAADSTPSPVSVSGGKVTFNGEVTAGACAVSGDDVNKVVQLDTVPVANFKAAGDVGNAKKAFEISLKDCDTTTFKTVSVTFTGQTDGTTPSLLLNTAGAGSAQNIGLQLYGPDGKELAMQTASSTTTMTDGNTTIHLAVDYKATAAAVTAGKVQSVADFMLTYQ